MISKISLPDSQWLSLFTSMSFLICLALWHETKWMKLNEKMLNSPQRENFAVYILLNYPAFVLAGLKSRENLNEQYFFFLIYNLSNTLNSFLHS